MTRINKRNALDATAIALIAAPLVGAAAWFMCLLGRMVRDPDPAFRALGWMWVGVVSLFVGILVTTRNDGRTK